MLGYILAMVSCLISNTVLSSPHTMTPLSCGSLAIGSSRYPNFNTGPFSTVVSDDETPPKQLINGHRRRFQLFQANGDLQSLQLQCFMCSTVNASEIVAGTGVDPGVFLSTLPLAEIPVTSRCQDSFDRRAALRAGASTVVCDDGLCVKINYTNRITMLATITTTSRRCHSCTTIDVDELLREVQDADWRRWLGNIRNVPRTSLCNDPLSADDALRAGARTTDCGENGVCMKMWLQEKGGQSHVWRSCVPGSRSLVNDCTRISSSQGEMELCTCDGQLCNAAATQRTSFSWKNRSKIQQLFLTIAVTSATYRLIA